MKSLFQKIAEFFFPLKTVSRPFYGHAGTDSGFVCWLPEEAGTASKYARFVGRFSPVTDCLDKAAVFSVIDVEEDEGAYKVFDAEDLERLMKDIFSLEREFPKNVYVPKDVVYGDQQSSIFVDRTTKVANPFYLD
jgi:hypothetical protein